MRKIENECVCCPSELGCLGNNCPNKNVVKFYCDRCGNEAILYDFGGEELCQNCLLDEFDIIEGSDEW